MELEESYEKGTEQSVTGENGRATLPDKCSGPAGKCPVPTEDKTFNKTRRMFLHWKATVNIMLNNIPMEITSEAKMAKHCFYFQGLSNTIRKKMHKNEKV